VYWLEDEFSIVRLKAGSVVEGKTLGNKPANNDPTAVMIVSTRSENEMPSLPK